MKYIIIEPTNKNERYTISDRQHDLWLCVLLKKGGYQHGKYKKT